MQARHLGPSSYQAEGGDCGVCFRCQPWFDAVAGMGTYSSCGARGFQKGKLEEMKEAAQVKMLSSSFEGGSSVINEKSDLHSPKR